MKTIHLILLFVAIALLLLVGGFGGRFFFPCDVVNVEATEDSIRARHYQLDSIAIANTVRDHILDSVNNLPTPDERLPERLRFVRSATRVQQLDSALTDPS